MREKISCLVVCFNEQECIEDCLESVRWCDEIVVVDSFSQDRTVEICRTYADRVIQREWKGFVDQKAFALEQATHEWVLNVDADERVTPELREEIAFAMNRWEDSVDVFRIPRVVFYLGRWWWRGGWYPDYQVRLFKKSKAAWGGREPHERVVAHGRTKNLKNPLVHLTYRDVARHIDKLNHFTQLAAEEIFLRGSRWNLWKALLHPFARFFKFFILRGGAFEGKRGVFVASTGALYVFLKYAKLWELEQQHELYRSGKGSFPSSWRAKVR
jgi:glycosyltransferase involved in cell wall biosynthesis